jgi:hypothetical protein
MKSEERSMKPCPGEFCGTTAQEVIGHYRKNDSFCGLKFFAYGINGLLRQGDQLSSAQAEAVRLLDVAITEAPVSNSDRVFFRGCSEKDFRPFETDEGFLSPSFLSLNANPLNAASFARNRDGEPSYLLLVLIPAGTRLLCISDNPTGSRESDEWLCARGLLFRSYPWDGTSGVSDDDNWSLHFQVPSARNIRLELIP